MNIRRYLLGVVSVFVLLAALDFLFDLLVLGPTNRSLSNVWRPDAPRWLEPVLYLATAVIFVYMFKLIYQQKGIVEALIIGVLFGLLISGIQSFRQYALYPIPLTLALMWTLEGLIQYALAGFVASLFHKPRR